jgi:3-methyladenine DNA glycosylase Mpg
MTGTRWVLLYNYTAAMVDAYCIHGDFDLLNVNVNVQGMSTGYLVGAM